MGVAEDTSDASIACRQVGPIKIVGELKDGERVFDEVTLDFLTRGREVDLDFKTRGMGDLQAHLVARLEGAECAIATASCIAAVTSGLGGGLFSEATMDPTPSATVSKHLSEACRS